MMNIHLSAKYNLTLDGMTMHTLLTALGDAETMYKKYGMTGLADNAVKAYKTILESPLATKVSATRCAGSRAK